MCSGYAAWKMMPPFTAEVLMESRVLGVLGYRLRA